MKNEVKEFLNNLGSYGRRLLAIIIFSVSLIHLFALYCYICGDVAGAKEVLFSFWVVVALVFCLTQFVGR